MCIKTGLKLSFSWKENFYEWTHSSIGGVVKLVGRLWKGHEKAKVFAWLKEMKNVVNIEGKGKSRV